MKPAKTILARKLGQRVRYLRKTNLLDQLALSKLSGVSRDYISEIECGYKNPSLSIVAELATALGVTLSELTKDL